MSKSHIQSGRIVTYVSHTTKEPISFICQLRATRNNWFSNISTNYLVKYKPSPNKSESQCQACMCNEICHCFLFYLFHSPQFGNLCWLCGCALQCVHLELKYTWCMICLFIVVTLWAGAIYTPNWHCVDIQSGSRVVILNITGEKSQQAILYFGHWA